MPLNPDSLSSNSRSKPRPTSGASNGAPRRVGRPPKDRKSSLEALFPVTPGTRESSSLKMIGRKYLHTLPQARSNPEQAAIPDLAESITELRARGLGVEGSGLLVPLLVTPMKDYTNEAGQPESGHYLVIAGGRRLLASERVQGLDELPCVVAASNEMATRIMQLTENVQRQDLPIFDESRELLLLQHEHKLSVRDLAALLGKEKDWVARRLQLPRVDVDVQQLLSLQRDSKGATLTNALLIDKVSNPLLRQRLLRAASQGASRKVLETIIAAHENKARPKPPAPQAAQHAPVSSHPLGFTQSGSTDAEITDAPLRQDKQSPSRFAEPEGRPFDAGSQLASISLDRTPAEASEDQEEAPAPAQRDRMDTMGLLIRPAASMLAQAAQQHEAGTQIPVVPAELVAQLESIERHVARLRALEEEAAEASAQEKLQEVDMIALSD